MKRSFSIAFFIMVIASLVCTLTAFSAGVPNTLNYQGTLTNNTGEPVTGSKTIVFKLYNVVSGGTALWTETKTVTVTNGNFSVVLGSTTPLTADKFTGDTWIGIKVGTDAEMAPRQKLTSVAYALKSLEVVNMPDPIPSGLIAMWSGSAANIPGGWALCNGANGTPNLTNRFIIGAGNTYAVNATGGSKIYNLSHTHTGPNHTHTYSGTTGTPSDENDREDSHADNNTPGRYHTHTYSGTTAAAGTENTGIGGSATQDIMPPYYALCFIMKL
jgi:microcystin-dependent protein